MLRSVLIAVAIAVAVVGWVLSGQVDLFAGDDRVVPVAALETTPPAAGKELVAVRARLLTAQPRTREVVVRGRTEALRSVDVRAETYGRVVAVTAKKGARVRRGAVLLRLATDERAARLTEARALVRQRQIEYDAAKSLSAKGFRAETKMAEASARLDSAKAQVKRMEVEVARLTIRAPFEGVVDRLPVEIGDYVKVGNVVATVVDEDPFLVVAQVSERDVGSLTVGDPGTAKLVDGGEVTGRLRYISATADPETRTFRIELEVPNKDRTLRDGITAEIRIAVEQTEAHLVSPAVLTLNDAGEVGVRLVDENDVVAFRRVSILNQGPEGIWLTGLPSRIRLITVGQEFVRDGDRVRVVLENPKGTS